MLVVATGTMKVLKKLDGGLDENGKPWAHFAAISCETVEEEEKKNDFYVLKTFGTTCEYVERNLVHVRRALVSGELKLEKYKKDIKISKDVSIEGEIYSIDFTSKVETQRTCVYVNTCDFLDARKEKKKDEDKSNLADVVLARKKA
jgi:hypothetical protein